MRFTWRLGWNNWTFGFWWGKFGRTGRYLIGVDFGPLELCWSDRRKEKK